MSRRPSASSGDGRRRRDNAGCSTLVLEGCAPPSAMTPSADRGCREEMSDSMSGSAELFGRRGRQGRRPWPVDKRLAGRCQIRVPTRMRCLSSSRRRIKRECSRSRPRPAQSRAKLTTHSASAVPRRRLADNTTETGPAGARYRAGVLSALRLRAETTSTGSDAAAAGDQGGRPEGLLAGQASSRA